MEEIIDTLVSEYRKVNLNTFYDWNFPVDCPIIFPKKVKSNFDKNIYAKKNIKMLLNTNYIDTSYWIIHEWGGIKSFKQNDKNNDRLNYFKQIISNNKFELSNSEFSIISSLSKVAAFYNPKIYAIYDSRVIYSLNWFIFLFGKNKKMFPQPNGRNSKMSEYDQRTIFNLSKIEYNYLETKMAYSEYCKFLQSIYKKTKINIQKMEMFLYAIADSLVIRQITEKIRLTTAST